MFKGSGSSDHHHHHHHHHRRPTTAPPHPPRRRSWIPRTRTVLELQVGKFHLVEVILQLRRSDLTWYSSNQWTIQNEILELLQRSILPRMCGEELEAFHRKRSKHLFPPQIGDANIARTSTTNAAATTSTSGKRKSMTNKRKRGVTTELSSKSATSATTTTTTIPVAPNTTVSEEQGRMKTTATTATPKDVYYAFGETIQLAYRRQERSTRKKPSGYAYMGATLFYKPNEEDDNNDNNSSSNEDNVVNKHKKSSHDKTNGKSEYRFRELKYLSHRILIWCSQLDPAGKTNPDPANVGFYRPELIPIASLFQQLDDDDDDDEHDDDDDDDDETDKKKKK